MKKQVLLVHGGDTFPSHEEYVAFLHSYVIEDLDKYRKKHWKDGLASNLGDEYDLIAPTFPNKYNCKYSEWSIWMEKILALLDDQVIFIGVSMGAVFLAKYINEHRLSNRVSKLILVAGPYNNEQTKYEYIGDFAISGDLPELAALGERVVVYYSTDDPVVPATELEKYRQSLPNAKYCIMSDRGHFGGEEFPEIATEITSA